VTVNFDLTFELDLLDSVKVNQRVKGHTVQKLLFGHIHTYTRDQIDIIRAVVIVWRVRGKIIMSVLCNIVCKNCAQCNAYTYEQT